MCEGDRMGKKERENGKKKIEKIRDEREREI